MLITPILRQVRPFNANADYKFYFTYQGGTQARANRLVITAVDAIGALEYDSSVESFSLEHVVPSGSLTNGVQYRAKIQVGDGYGNWSAFSEEIFFWVLDDPVITIPDTIINYTDNNRVYNQTIIFSADWVHPNSEIVTSYRYLLYDSNQNLIQSFPVQYPSGATTLTQEIAGLQNKTTYFLKIETETEHFQLSSSGFIEFQAWYVTPELSARLTVNNNLDEGAVELTSDIFQLILVLQDPSGNIIPQESIVFDPAGWIDMNNVAYGKLIAQEGFASRSSELFLQLWAKNIPDDVIFLTIFSPEGKTDLIMYGNQVHAFKYLYSSTIVAHFVSNELAIGVDEIVVIGLKQYQDLIELNITAVI